MSSIATQHKISISLGDQKLESTPSGFRRLANFYHECSKHKDEIIIIDFSNLQWFDANLTSILLSMMYLLNQERNLIFEIDYNLMKSKFDILFRNGFIPSDDDSVKENFDSCIRLQSFNKEDDVAFLDYIENELLAHNGLSQMSKEDKSGMIVNMCEVFANVSHARTEHPIFACGQYYPRNKVLKFSLVDLGIGYLTPIREYTGGDITCPKEAIQWAIGENSTKPDAPGGMGLPDLLSFLKSTGGNCSIISDGVYWLTDAGKLGPRTVKNHLGTIITIEFNCN